jgi:hypothetical protein
VSMMLDLPLRVCGLIELRFNSVIAMRRSGAIHLRLQGGGFRQPPTSKVRNCRYGAFIGQLSGLLGFGAGWAREVEGSLVDGSGNRLGSPQEELKHMNRCAINGKTVRAKGYLRSRRNNTHPDS